MVVMSFLGKSRKHMVDMQSPQTSSSMPRTQAFHCQIHYREQEARLRRPDC